MIKGFEIEMSSSSFDCLNGNYYISATSLVLEFRGFIDSHPTLYKVNHANGCWSEIVQYCEYLEQYPVLLRAITRIHLSSQIDFERALFCAWCSLLVSRLLKLPALHQKSIFFAGLLQDIGKYSSEGYELTGSSVSEISRIGQHFEVSINEQHALVSASIIEKYVPDHEGICDLVLHHHAREDGTGYPRNVGETQLGVDNQILIIANELSDSLDELGGHNQIAATICNLRLRSLLYFDRVHVFWLRLFEPHINPASTDTEAAGLFDRVEQRVASLEGLLSSLLIASAELVRFDFDINIHGLRMMIRRLAYLSSDTGIFDPALFQQKINQTSDNGSSAIVDLDSMLKGLPETLKRLEVFLDEILSAKKYDVDRSILQDAKRNLHQNIIALEGKQCGIFR